MLPPRNHKLILFSETYKRGYELRHDVEQVYLGIFQQPAVAPCLCIYYRFGIRVRRTIHNAQLIKQYSSRDSHFHWLTTLYKVVFSSNIFTESRETPLGELS